MARCRPRPEGAPAAHVPAYLLPPGHTQLHNNRSKRLLFCTLVNFPPIKSACSFIVPYNLSTLGGPHILQPELPHGEFLFSSDVSASSGPRWSTNLLQVVCVMCCYINLYVCMQACVIIYTLQVYVEVSHLPQRPPAGLIQAGSSGLSRLLGLLETHCQFPSSRGEWVLGKSSRGDCGIQLKGSTRSTRVDLLAAF